MVPDSPGFQAVMFAHREWKGCWDEEDPDLALPLAFTGRGVNIHPYTRSPLARKWPLRVCVPRADGVPVEWVA